MNAPVELSVVMPYLNEAETIAPCIEKHGSALNAPERCAP